MLAQSAALLYSNSAVMRAFKHKVFTWLQT